MAGGAAQAPLEELRLALVLNGGVSLAVWMGGVTRELDLLVRGHRHGTSDHASGPYAAALDLARTWASVDVISGTSAGGINGAALALSQVNENADLGALRDLWAEQGDLDNLLRAPFRGQPTSLLRGDDYFLPALTRAMRGLSADFAPTDAEVDLTITTTLLHGALTVTTDGLGQRLPQRHHGARFRFSTSTDMGRDDDFAPGRVDDTAAAMALAARCTAGFPFAFEPSYVPVGTTRPGAPSGPQVEEPPGVRRPDMAAWASWAARAGEPPSDQSRFAVDGGVLANTPTREALDAIDRRPARRPMRRVMMLVFPHAPVVEAGARQHDPADRPDRPPSVADSLTGVLGALTAQGSLTFVEEIDAHNREAARWRGGRLQVLENSDLDGVYGLVRSAWRHYRWARTRAAAGTLAERVPRPEGWTHARVVEAAATANQGWSQQTGEPLPYVPLAPPLTAPPTLEGEDSLGTTWRWGTTVALGVADSAAEILREAQGVACEGTELEEIGSALEAVSEARDTLLEVRDSFDRTWWDVGWLNELAPDAAYWQARLFCYRRAMLGEGTQDLQRMTELVDTLLNADGTWAVGPPDQPRTESQLAKRDALAVDLLEAYDSSECGQRTAAAVWCVVDALHGASEVVLTIAQDARRSPMTRLGPWAEILDPLSNQDEPEDQRLRLLTRLLTLDCATWLLADAESQGTSQEIRLAQLSLDLVHPFARVTRSPDDKVAGSELHRFGGFLKRSWRINDWIWGRLDAAQMLCRLVLEPQRLLRIHTLTGRSAEDMIEELVSASYTGAAPPTDEPFATMRTKATAELVALFAGERTTSARGFLPHLAALAAYPVQQRIIADELPALASAVRADGIAGASKRSHGERFLAQQETLLQSLRNEGADAWHRSGSQALVAFDQAGIGREPLEAEARSDAMIRTAVTAAASIVTVADSARFGVKAVKPVSRVVRAAALVPYWLVTGLISGGAAARSLALLGFATGGVLLALSLFGVLGGLSSVGSTVGIGVLLGALGYAALRSGTLLHGVVLLGPVVPLLAYAFDAPLEQSGDGATASAAVESAAEATRAGVSVIAVLALAAGLVALASLPHPLRSPLATLLGRSRRALVLTLVALVLAAGGAWALVRWWDDVRDFAEGRWSWARDLLPGDGVGTAVVATALALLLAALGGWSRGRGMRRWSQDDEDRWVLEDQATHPAAVSAGWAAVYGAGYLASAWATYLVADAWLDARPAWLTVTIAWAAVLGGVLCVVGPTWITWRARRRLRAAIESLALARSTAQPDEPASDHLERDFVTGLERRGRLFGYLLVAAGIRDRLVGRRMRGVLEQRPRLSGRGRALLADHQRAQERRAGDAGLTPASSPPTPPRPRDRSSAGGRRRSR